MNYGCPIVLTPLFHQSGIEPWKWVSPLVDRSSHLNVIKTHTHTPPPQACAKALLLGDSRLTLAVTWLRMLFVILATSRLLALCPCLVSIAPLLGLDLWPFVISLSPSKYFSLKFVKVGLCGWQPKLLLTDGVPCSLECLLALTSLREVDSRFAD